MSNPVAADELVVPELEAARELLVRLHALGVVACFVGLVRDTPVVVSQNERDIVPLCNRVLAAYYAPIGCTRH